MKPRFLALSGLICGLLGLAAPRAAALPNLAPYQPSGWDDKIVASTATGTSTNAPHYYSTDTIWIDFAVANLGTSDTTGNLVVELRVDGAYRARWTLATPLPANQYVYATDYSLGSLAAGTHTLEIRADPDGAMSESNETDNSYTKTIQVVARPNLRPYQPAGWGDKLVLTTNPGTSVDSTSFLPTDTIYVDFSMINDGGIEIGTAFSTQLIVDGSVVATWNITSPFPPNTPYSVTDYPLGSLTPGSHQLEIVTDSSVAIDEDNESDNSYSKTIHVEGPPNLATYLPPYLPEGWSDTIVVSSATGTHLTNSDFDASQPLYVDWIIRNSGGSAVTNSFVVQLYLDDVLLASWTNNPPIEVDAYVSVDDVSIGILAAGTHTLRIVADPAGSVAEANETDNAYSVTFAVSHYPNLAPFTPQGWSDSLVVTRTPGTFVDSPFPLTSESLYVNWTVLNWGSGTANAAVTTQLYIDDVLEASWTTAPPIASGGYFYQIDYPIGTLTAGPHTMRLVTDSENVIAEYVETDNETTKLVEVLAADPDTPPDIRIEPPAIGFPAPAATPAPSTAPPAQAPKPAAKVRRLSDGRQRGMPANPEPFVEIQPDGTPITLRLRGGVRYHWFEDLQGFTVVRQNGAYVYAGRDQTGSLTPLPLLVGRDDPQAAGLRRFERPTPAAMAQLNPQAPAPTPPLILTPSPITTPAPATVPLGTVRNAVILMRFSNHVGRTLPTPADYDRIFNAAGGDPTLAPTGSVRDFYFENSYGQLTLNSTVYAWVTLPNTEAYYAAGISGLGTKIREAIHDALVLADTQINFSQFDADGDGFVDAITFIHSGYGAEFGGTSSDGAASADRIWSHRWTIPTWTSAEGVKVSDYHINPGLWGTSGSAPTRIGVVCHETGHFFGLPDLYDTDYSGSGVGSYDLMANSWGFTGDQRHPPHFGAWCKVQLGWVTPTILSTPGSYSLPQAETSASVFRIDHGYPTGEYLLVENREPTGFESTMPQGGLAIWHIDENSPSNDIEGFPGQAGWPENGNHYQVALLQADGYFDLESPYNNRGDAGDLYRASGVSEINTFTLPNTDSYQSGHIAITGNRLYGISAPGATMTFSYDVTALTNRFRIANSGTGYLRVDNIAPATAAPWLSISPAPPYALAPGDERWVTVNTDLASAPVGTTTTRLTVTSNDPDENPFPNAVDVTVTRQPPAAQVVGRWVFYNHSSWDGTDASANAQDDAGIATDKSALLPGGTASFANYTSSTLGLNGVMVDIANLAGTPTAADFTFRIGNANDTSGWSAAPAPTSVTRRAGAGTAGSDRVTVVWSDNAIQQRWLQVTVKATANTGLAAPDVFYFGNAIGDCGNSSLNAQVDLADEIGARNHPRTFLNPSTITDVYDYNRDKRVDLADEIAARNHLTTFLTALKLITPTGAGAAPSLAFADSARDSVSDSLASSNPPILAAAPGKATMAFTPATSPAPTAGVGSALWVERDRGHAHLVAETAPGQTYQVQTCDDLTTAAWNAIALPLEPRAAAGRMTWILPTDGPRFYRVVTTGNGVVTTRQNKSAP